MMKQTKHRNRSCKSGLCAGRRIRCCGTSIRYRELDREAKTCANQPRLAPTNISNVQSGCCAWFANMSSKRVCAHFLIGTTPSQSQHDAIKRPPTQDINFTMPPHALRDAQRNLAYMTLDGPPETQHEMREDMNAGGPVKCIVRCVKMCTLHNALVAHTSSVKTRSARLQAMPTANTKQTTFIGNGAEHTKSMLLESGAWF